MKPLKTKQTFVSNIPLDTRRKPTTHRVIVDDKYTYETDLTLEIGDRVILPSPKKHLSVDATWEGTVTSLTSNYTGPCKQILSKA